MKKAIFTLACVLLALTMLVRISSSATYDPWVDLDDNGTINIFDVVTLANSYQTTGDPTKTVTVTNWPQSEVVSVWYEYPLADGTGTATDLFSANGYATLHLLIYVGGLSAGETADFTVVAPLWDGAHTWSYTIPVYSATFTSSWYYGAMSLNVPSAEFYFTIYAPPGSAFFVCLSYYLTWS